MLRLVPAFVAGGLATLWIIALTLQTEAGWLTWWLGTIALIGAAVVALVPARGSAIAAAISLAAAAMALFALWRIGLAMGVSPWLTWWTMVAALSTLLSSAALTAQGLLHRSG